MTALELDVNIAPGRVGAHAQLHQSVVDHDQEYDRDEDDNNGDPDSAHDLSPMVS